MAAIHKPLSEKDLKQATAAKLKNLYLELAQDMKDILAGKIVRCPKCGNWMVPDQLYADDRYSPKVFPICKKCLGEMASRGHDGVYGDRTRLSVMNTLKIMDRPYVKSIYNKAVQAYENVKGRKNFSAIFDTYVSMLLLAPEGKKGFNIRSLVDMDTELLDLEVSKDVVDRFGTGFTKEDYEFLQREYDDWVSRYDCSTKAQEQLFKSMACNRLEEMKLRRDGKSTKDVEATFTNLLTTANLTPRQNKADAFMEAQTLGTLIQKWEENEPLPELDESLEDVEHIGLICELMNAHTCKTAGIKNAYSENYEKFLAEYTVLKPEYHGDEDEDDILSSLFDDDAL